jgi:DNA-binding MarR family transcriptional regulator
MNTAESSNKISQANDSIRRELEVLFEETVDLANRLKTKARQTHRGERLSASGRILLQGLQLLGPQTVPALAHIRSTSRQNIQVLVDKLAAAGYIEFVPNPGHKRSDFVRLTEAGRVLLSSANERETGLLATLLPHTTAAEVRASAELLRKLRLLLGGERKQRKSRPVSSADEYAVVVAETETASRSIALASVESAEELPVSLL